MSEFSCVISSFSGGEREREGEIDPSSFFFEVATMGKIIAVTFMLLLSCSSSVFSAAVSDTWESNRLFNVMADANTSNILECVHMKDIDSCTKIDIDFEAMMQSDDIIMAEDDFIFKRKYSTEDENGQSQSFSYEGANFSYAVLTYSEAPGYPDLNGRIHYTKDGASYMIDNCGENCHVLIKLGKGLMEIKEPIESPVAPGVSALSAEELDPVVSRNASNNLNFVDLNNLSVDTGCLGSGAAGNKKYSHCLYLCLLYTSI